MLYSNVTILLQGILNRDINLIDILIVYIKLCNVVISNGCGIKYTKNN